MSRKKKPQRFKWITLVGKGLSGFRYEKKQAGGGRENSKVSEEPGGMRESMAGHRAKLGGVCEEGGGGNAGGGGLFTNKEAED